MSNRLLNAVRANDLGALRAAIAAGEPLDERDPHGYTAVLAAARAGYTDLCIALLDAGARPDAHDRKLAARRWEKLGTVAPPQPAGPGSLLHEAATASHGGSLVRALLARGLDLEGRDPDGSTPLMIAAFRHQPHLRVAPADDPLEVLLAAGAAVNARDRAGHTALDTATDLATIERLLAAGADPNGSAGVGPGFYDKPLLVRWSMAFGNSAVVRALLAAGADPQRATGALAWAAHYGHADVVRVLLAHGFPPDDRAGDTPALAYAAAHARLDIVHMLLAAGARELDLGLLCAAGHAPLTGITDMRERPAHRLEAVQTLLTAGADPSARQPRFLHATPLHAAATVGSAAIAELLLTAGAAVDAADDLGRTPLWLAAESGSARVVELLLRAGADPRALAGNGVSPYAIARRSTSPADLIERRPDTGAQMRVMALLREAGGGPERPPEPAPPEGPAVGGRVRHGKFGDGTIRAIEDATTKLTIDFDDGATRVLLARFIEPVL